MCRSKHTAAEAFDQLHQTFHHTLEDAGRGAGAYAGLFPL